MYQEDKMERRNFLLIFRQTFYDDSDGIVKNQYFVDLGDSQYARIINIPSDVSFPKDCYMSLVEDTSPKYQAENETIVKQRNAMDCNCHGSNPGDSHYCNCGLK